ICTTRIPWCEEDHKDFIDRFISYITLAKVNNNVNILTILDRSLKGKAREWYYREFDNKNWELENVLDNSGIGATIAHIRGANAGGIMGAVASFPNVSLGLTDAQIIFARNMLEIEALRQGVYESVSLFWAKIQKYGDQPGYTPAQKKTHFLSGVRPDIRDEIYRIGQTKPINDIIDSLAELELRHGILQQALLQLRHAPIAFAIPDVIPQQPAFSMADMQKMIQDAFAKQRAESKAEIEKLKAELQAQQPQVATVGNFQPLPKFYPIKSEKTRQTFYIVDQEEGGHKDVPISIKYKNKWVTETGHVVVIDDGKLDYLLCLEMPWIRKVQEILDTNKHEFRMIVVEKLILF
ncbi:3119_t:CDS:2, partial [Dentiscutata erythropus]